MSKPRKGYFEDDEITLSSSLDPRRHHRKVLVQPPSRAVSPTPEPEISIVRSGPAAASATGIAVTRPHELHSNRLQQAKHRDIERIEKQTESISISRKRQGSFSSRRSSTFDSPLFEDSPWRLELQHSGNGGLRNAIKRAEADGNVTKLWIGTLGMPTDALSESKKAEIESTLLTEDYDSIPVFLSDTTFEGHYSHYCKQILWPTLHYQTPDNPKSKAYQDHSWVHYKALNQAFADKIVKVYKEGDIIWVNDYHLMLLPAMLREKLPNAKIGFFLHVAFPSSEVFRCLAARKEFLEGMLGANCVGFQISEYSRHFLQTCNRILAVDTTPEGIKSEHSFVSVVNYAIGIDLKSLDITMQNSEGVGKWRKMICERWKDKKLIVSRDKLDNIRGIKQKLLAYEEFLRAHPEWIERAVLVQIGLYDGSDSEFESEIHTIVDRINSMRADLTATQPVLFLQQYIDFDQYLALIAEADIFAVTSLREGMNLTCHEYIYCNQKHGPLILSEFTGSASVLGDDSLLINPWDISEVANAFYQAITMSEQEKAARWMSLYSYVTNNTCAEWVHNFVKEVDVSWEEDQRRRSDTKHRLHAPLFIQQYQSVPRNGKRIFFLNMDSTDIKNAFVRTNSSTSINSANSTSPFRNTPPPTGPITAPNSASSGKFANSSVLSAVVPTGTGTSYASPQRKISVLNELVLDPANIVYVISRESRNTMERIFRRVNNLGLIAESGGLLRPFGSDEWIRFSEEHCARNISDKWQDPLMPMLESMAERFSGSRIVTNETSIHFDLHSVVEQDPDRASVIIGEVINSVNDAFGEIHVHARLAEDGKVIIARDDLTDADAVQYAFDLERAQIGKDFDYLFVTSLGSESSSDTYDTLYEWANGHEKDVGTVCTVSVGAKGTLAKWTLDGINSLLNLLLTATSQKN
ncbi:Tps3p [Sugiyamaella lignohabitans]|uniref:Tps3p n=1 Tax=Sugiyamaella lignohabitans TaxID=796027 RepID=A0A167FIH6_9ASCO|nr:Tps3p [Sugiyamaella lignohabitans]ANB15343.1 Tps3p [Sugiyamaella lignohabitans]